MVTVLPSESVETTVVVPSEETDVETTVLEEVVSEDSVSVS